MFTFLFCVLILLWFASSTKSALFWLYLLQLKEYKFRRLADHFNTAKGRKLLLAKLTLAKIILVFTSFLSLELAAAGAFMIFGIESVLIIRGLYQKSLLRPIMTPRSAPVAAAFFLLQTIFGALIVYLASPFAVIYLLVFNIFIPIIAIGVILSLKPFNFIRRQKLFAAAREKRAEFKDLLVIGVTGSYGKTSTKDFLYEILKDKFKCLKTAENQNSETAVADLMLNKLNQEHEIFICEMAAYFKREIKRVCDMVQPKIGIFLGANEQHLALFGSMENLLKAEGGGELLESLPPQGLAVFNGNNRYAYELWRRAEIAKKITYAPNLIDIVNPEKRNTRAEDISVFTDHISFRVVSGKDAEGAEFKINVLGAMNIENVLLAAAVGEELGLSLAEMAKAAQRIKPREHSMILRKSSGGVNIIDSTYSSNPTAVKAHLEYLKVWGAKRKIVIMPCLIELGDASGRAHFQIGKDLARIADLAIITTREEFENTLKGAVEEIGLAKAVHKIIFMDDTSAIAAKIQLLCSKGDVILLEGRAPETLLDQLALI